MSHKLVTTFSLIVLIALLILGIAVLNSYYANLPERISQHETIVLGQSRLVPGSQAALRVLVRDSKDALPLEGAEIRVALKPNGGGAAVPVYEGKTDRQGTANIAFAVPEGGEANQTLIVETKSRLGTGKVESPVTLERDFRVLLTTDKPIYQPGQQIHLRALALSAFDLKPAAGQDLVITIADGKGNKVFRKLLTTTEFGAAAADFQLAGEVNTGPYKISATLGNTSSEKTVTVEHYVLPKFEVDLQTEKPYYLPGEHVTGSLKAGYFFGKPVAGGQVKLEGATFDVQRNLVFTIEGQTDADGNYAFEFDLPGYIAGSDLEGGLGRFYLQASVTDEAQHTETSDLSLPVSQNSLVVQAVPEGGQFRPGVENILYLMASYPDGSPAEATLSLTFYDSGKTLQAQTGAFGLAEVRYTPNSPYQGLQITAQDTRGNSFQKEFYFEGQYYEETVLLRPEFPVYRVGQTMNLALLASNPEGTVYLDIVREGQTVSTRSLEIRGGHGEAAVDLTPDLYGTLELHAYKVLRSGTIVRDTRLVVVDNAADLSVSMTPGQDTYRPGDSAGLDVQVSGQDGAGVRAALGLAIVDESVFALAEQDPGFAKLYFLLEQELLQPKYDLHGMSLTDLVSGKTDTISSEPTVRAIETAARASLAAAAPQGAGFSLQANSHQEAMQHAYSLQRAYFNAMSRLMYLLALALPVAGMALSLVALAREKRLASSLAMVLGLLLAIVLLFFLWPLGPDYAWATSPLDRFSVLFGRLNAGFEWFFLGLLLAGLAGFLALLVHAIRKGDRPMGAVLALAALFAVVVIALAYALGRSDLYPGTGPVALGLLAFFLMPVAFLLRSAGYAGGKQGWPAAGALAVGAFLLVGGLPVLAMTGRGGGFAAQATGMLRDGGPMLVEEAMIEAPAAAMPAPAATMTPAGIDMAKGLENESAAAGATPQPPRLRQYFPETMLWLPDAVTDEGGALHLDIPVADSITTWRVTALASSQDGRLGSAQAPLRVFQDFFIDLDLPLALTVGDEVAVPVGVFNYLAEAQSVRLEIEQAPWFELLDEPVKEMQIAANDISVVYFRVRAKDFGRQAFKVTALGSQMSDAIQKEVRVFPNGKQIRFTQSDRLAAGEPAHAVVSIPAGAIPGTQTLAVKVYPGIVSQVVEGLDSILQMPYGCFEQTSSTTYPNVLVMDYLKKTGQASPEVQMKAEEYINLGYQRLTTFEVESSGGFSLFGDAPADRMLTAYGLQEFADMSKVHDVDPALVQRAAEWLLGQQAADGAWENDRGLVHESTWSSLGNDRLPVTAYIVWSLIDAGYLDDARTQKGLQYVREFRGQAEDAYVAALVANALVAADRAGGGPNPATQAALDRLAEMAVQDGSSVYWQSGVATFMGSEGTSGSIETTALAALALLRADAHPELANAALTYLVKAKDAAGTWYTTQATVLSLKALLQSLQAGAENVDANVTVTLNGGQSRSLKVTPENFDVVQLVTFEDVNPGKDNVVEIRVEGQGNLMYQAAGSYYLPWDKLALYPELAGGEDLVTIDVTYDRTELAVNDSVGVNVTVTLNQPGAAAESAMIDLGVPPGFAVQAEDLAALVARFNDVPADYAFPTIERYELTGRQILVYVRNLKAGAPLAFSYRLLAKFPLTAQAPASNAYDYYNPDVNGLQAPQLLVVRGGEE